MRFLLWRALALLALATTVICAPGNDAELIERIADHLPENKKVEATKDDIEWEIYRREYEAMKARSAGYRNHIAAIRENYPYPPQRSYLTHSTDDDLDDLRKVQFVDHAEVARMGKFKSGAGFLGVTPNGRLVFSAPDKHGMTLHVPIAQGEWNEQLVAHNPSQDVDKGMIHRYGWSKIHGYGPKDAFYDIAIKVNDKQYLLGNGIPINRMATTNADGTTKLFRLGDSIPAKVYDQYYGPTSDDLNKIKKVSEAAARYDPGNLMPMVERIRLGLDKPRIGVKTAEAYPNLVAGSGSSSSSYDPAVLKKDQRR